MFCYILQVKISLQFFLVSDHAHVSRSTRVWFRSMQVAHTAIGQAHWSWPRGHESKITRMYSAILRFTVNRFIKRHTVCHHIMMEIFFCFEAFGSSPTVILFGIETVVVFLPQPASVYFKPDTKSPIECTILADDIDGLVTLFVWTLTKINC